MIHNVTVTVSIVFPGSQKFKKVIYSPFLNVQNFAVMQKDLSTILRKTFESLWNIYQVTENSPSIYSYLLGSSRSVKIYVITLVFFLNLAENRRI